VLTAAGESLAAFAVESLRRVDDFLGELREDVPVVRIAAGRAALRWVISGPLQAIARSGRSVHILTANREAALAALTGGQADLAITAAEPPPAPLAAKEIASYPQVLVVPARHRLAQRSRVRLSDLAGLTCWCRRPGGPTAARSTRPWPGRAWTGASRPRSTAGTCWCTSPRSASAPRSSTAASRLPSRLRTIPISDLPAVRYWAAWRPQRTTALAAVLGHL
jgi:DNA-binding transcriptional LysR family regulator